MAKELTVDKRSCQANVVLLGAREPCGEKRGRTRSKPLQPCAIADDRIRDAIRHLVPRVTTVTLHMFELARTTGSRKRHCSESDLSELHVFFALPLARGRVSRACGVVMYATWAFNSDRPARGPYDG